MTKVLVTGGAGFIGSHVVECLLENNIECVVVDNLSSGSIHNLPENSLRKFYGRDIVRDDYEDIFVNERPEYVVHLAAQTSVISSTQNPVEDAHNNIIAPITLLNLCKKYNIKKFITASSAAVYGAPKTLPIDEDHQTKPISYYGLSKLTMEKYIQMSQVPYIIFRFSNAYGERQYSSKESGVISIFDEDMKNNNQIYIYGDGEQIRDFVYVKDIASAVMSAIDSDIQNEIMNFSSNTGITLNKLFEAMKKLYGYEQAPNYLPVRSTEIKESILSNKKAVELLEIKEFTSLETGVSRLREWSLKK